MINIFVRILKHDVEERRNTVAVEIETFLMPTSPLPPLYTLSHTGNVRYPTPKP